MPTFYKYGIITLIGALLFIPFLGNVPLFDWDEANFAEAAREMIVQKEYSRVFIDFQPFWEKPPVFIWMQALSMQLWGVNEFAARFPNAIMGILTLCSLFYIGKKVSTERVAIWWVLLYIACWLPHFYFKTAIIDPTFNFFIFWAVYHIHQIKFAQKRPVQYALLSGFFLGLAVLTKGPAALLICVLTLIVYWVVQKGQLGFAFKYLLWIVFACFITSFSWFGIDILQNGWWFTQEFITYQIRLLTTEDAGHGGPFFYHFIVLLFGCFPAAAFLFQAGKKSTMHSINRRERDFVQWMWCLFGLVLILFSLVKTKIVHYSSLCYLPLTYLAAVQIARISIGSIQMKSVVKWLFVITGSIIAFAIMLLPVAGNHLASIIPYVKDDFAVANMGADVTWPMWWMLFGMLLLATIIWGSWTMRRHFQKGLQTIIIAQVAMIFLTMALFVPKIEKYSQAAAIDFYKQFEHEDVYVQPLGFKSYAYLFYSKPSGSVPAAHYNNKVNWLLEGDIDKPAYFICKVHQAHMYQDHPNLKKIGEKNGYVFFERIMQ